MYPPMDETMDVSQAPEDFEPELEFLADSEDLEDLPLFGDDECGEETEELEEPEEEFPEEIQPQTIEINGQEMSLEEVSRLSRYRSPKKPLCFNKSSISVCTGIADFIQSLAAAEYCCCFIQLSYSLSLVIWSYFSFHRRSCSICLA